MTRGGVLLALLALAACHRNAGVASPDADADLQARTAAKTQADLAAADAAARAPLPPPEANPVRVAPSRPAVAAGEEDDALEETGSNGVAASADSPQQ